MNVTMTTFVPVTDLVMSPGAWPVSWCPVCCVCCCLRWSWPGLIMCDVTPMAWPAPAPMSPGPVSPLLILSGSRPAPASPLLWPGTRLTSLLTAALRRKILCASRERVRVGRRGGVLWLSPPSAYLDWFVIEDIDIDMEWKPGKPDMRERPL